MLPERGGLLRIVAQVLAQLLAAMRDQEEDHADNGDDDITTSVIQSRLK
jgi:hypothetical protein